MLKNKQTKKTLYKNQNVAWESYDDSGIKMLYYICFYKFKRMKEYKWYKGHAFVAFWYTVNISLLHLITDTLFLQKLHD